MFVDQCQSNYLPNLEERYNRNLLTELHMLEDIKKKKRKQEISVQKGCLCKVLAYRREMEFKVSDQI